MEEQIKKRKEIGRGAMELGGYSTNGDFIEKINQIMKGSRGEDCLQIYNVLVSHGWNDQACDTEIRFVCGCQLCSNDNNNDSSVTSNYTINYDSNQVNCTSNPMDKPIMKVAIASGALLLVVIY